MHKASVKHVSRLEIGAAKAGAPTAARVGVVRAFRPLERYEKRSDGFIYPIRMDDVSYGDANNILSLRAGLYEQIEALKEMFVLMEMTVAFAQSVAALGGMASMVHSGPLFQPIPKIGKQAPSKTSTPPKTGGSGAGRQKLLDSKQKMITSDNDPRSAKRSRKTKTTPKTVYEVKKASSEPDTQAEVRMAERLAEDGHEVHFNANDRRGDLIVDGVRTDVKHLEKADSIPTAIGHAKKQAEQVIIDGTTVGLSHQDAVEGVNAFEAIAAKHPGPYRNIKTIHVVQGDGKSYIYHRSGAPLKVERAGAGGSGKPR